MLDIVDDYLPAGDILAGPGRQSAVFRIRLDGDFVRRGARRVDEHRRSVREDVVETLPAPAVDRMDVQPAFGPGRKDFPLPGRRRIRRGGFRLNGGLRFGLAAGLDRLKRFIPASGEDQARQGQQEPSVFHTLTLVIPRPNPNTGNSSLGRRSRPRRADS